MVDPTAKPSVSRQATVLGISRGSIYYQHRPVSDADLKLMHRIDKRHMDFLTCPPVVPRSDLESAQP